MNNTQTAQPKLSEYSIGEISETRYIPGKADVDPVGHARSQSRLYNALGWLTPVLFLALWELAGIQEWINTSFFPAPTMIANTAVEMVDNGTLQHDLLISFRRIAMGFSIGVVLGVSAGILLGLSRTLRAAIEPFLTSLYTIPKLALLPLLLLIFGLGEIPMVSLVALGVFFIMWITVIEAVLGVDKGYTEAARSFGAKGWKLFRHVTFPAVLPQIFVGMRIAIGNAVLVLIGIEFVQSSEGIGYRIWHSWSLFSAEPMYVGIVTVSIMGYLLSLVVRIIGRAATPWSLRDDKRAARGSRLRRPK